MRPMLVSLTSLSLVAFSVFADEKPPLSGDTEQKEERAKGEGKKGEEMSASVALLTGSATGGARKTRFGGFALLEWQLGSGTFVKDEQARQPLFAWLLSLRPRYFFTDNLFAELRIDIQQELTTSYVTKTTAKRQVMPSDTLFTLKYQNLVTIPWVNIQFSPFLRLVAPTSYESQYRDLYLATGVGFDLSRKLGPFVLVYTFRFNKNFNKYTVATVEKSYDKPVIAARGGGAEDLGNVVATGSNNTSFSVFNSLMGSWVISEQWTFTVQWAVANAWTYFAGPDDIYKAPDAKTGRGQRDLMYGVVDLTYQPWEHFGFSFGLSTQQQVKTADNKTIRFPFWDFHTPGDNNSVIYLDFFATY